LHLSTIYNILYKAPEEEKNVENVGSQGMGSPSPTLLSNDQETPCPEKENTMGEENGAP
jgi:hypothetical protein